MSHETSVEARGQTCDVLKEWANAKCSADTHHGPIATVVRGVARTLFDRERGDAQVTNEDLSKKMAKVLMEFKLNIIPGDDDACVDRSVHAILLSYLASWRNMPDEYRQNVLTNWKLVWDGTLAILTSPETQKALGFKKRMKVESFGSVNFNPIANDACDPSELGGGDAFCGGCVVS